MTKQKRNGGASGQRPPSAAAKKAAATDAEIVENNGDAGAPASPPAPAQSAKPNTDSKPASAPKPVAPSVKPSAPAQAEAASSTAPKAESVKPEPAKGAAGAKAEATDAQKVASPKAATDEPKANASQNNRPAIYAGIGAVAGGLVVLLGGQLMNGDQVDYEPRIAAVEQRVEQSSGAALAATAEAKTTLDAIDGMELKVDALEAQISSSKRQLAELKDAIIERGQNGEGGAIAANAAAALQIKELQAEIAALKATFAEAPGTGGGADPAEIDALKAELAERDATIQQLSAAVEGYAARLDALEATTTEASVELYALQSAEAERSAAFEALTDQNETADAVLADQAKRLDTLEAAAPEKLRSADAAAADFAYLSVAMNADGPFVEAVARLEESSDISAPAALREAAKAGLPTRAALAGRFEEASRAALVAIAQSEAKRGGLLDRLGALVVVRSTTETAGLDPDAALSRAKTRVERGDVAGAVEQVMRMAAPAQKLNFGALAPALAGPFRLAASSRAAIAFEAMKPWLADAQRRIDAEAALEEYRAALFESPATR